jgi:hypothetical protein
MNITGNPASWHATIPCIDDGDTCSNAEHGATAQALADNLEWLKLWNQDPRIVAVPLLPTQNSSSRFSLVHANTSIAYYSQTDTTSAGRLGFPGPSLPIGRRITQVVAWCMNASSSALPATMPTLTLYRSDIAAFTDSTIGTLTDPTATLAAYKLIHTITLNVNELIQEAHQYAIAFTGEASTNAVPGLALWALRVRCSP